MIIIVFVLALFVFNEMKIAGKNEFFHDYISVKSTTAINGVFVFLNYVYVVNPGNISEFFGNLLYAYVDANNTAHIFW